MAEGLWKRRRKRGPHRRWRPRKEHFGELVQMDGSFHAWFDSAEHLCRIDMVDDATGRMAGRFFEQETTEGAMRVLWGWIEQFGIPRALYTDTQDRLHHPARAESRGAAGRQTARPVEAGIGRGQVPPQIGMPLPTGGLVNSHNGDLRHVHLRSCLVDVELQDPPEPRVGDLHQTAGSAHRHLGYQHERERLKQQGEATARSGPWNRSEMHPATLAPRSRRPGVNVSLVLEEVEMLPDLFGRVVDLMASRTSVQRKLDCPGGISC